MTSNVAQMTLRAFDPRQVFADFVGTRKVVYLDQNLWIELADSSDADIVAARTRLGKLVQTSRVICPLSYAAVSELVDQPPELRESRATLMDLFSNGVVVRNSDEVRLDELQAMPSVVQGREPPNTAFGLLPDYLGDFHLIPSGTSPLAYSIAEFVRDSMRTAPEVRSVQQFLGFSCIEDLRQRHLAEARNYIDKMQPELDSTRAVIVSEARDRHYVLHRVRQHLYTSWFLPRIGDVGVGLSPAPERKALKRLFEFLPTTNLLAEFFAARYMDINRKVPTQDFYDTEHATAAVYSHIFATADGNLFTVLRQCTSLRARGCKIVRGVTGLTEALSSLS